MSFLAAEIETRSTMVMKDSRNRVGNHPPAHARGLSIRSLGHALV